MLLSSPLILFNLLQTIQAQTTPLSSRTTEPADGADRCTRITTKITFDAKRTASPSRPQIADITGGTFQTTYNHDGQILYSGKFYAGRFTNNSETLYCTLKQMRLQTILLVALLKVTTLEYNLNFTSCSTSDTNTIYV
jgi:hypothetical protein